MLTDINAIVFYVFAVLVLGGGILTITQRNAVHSAISLIVSLLGVAGLYLLQQAEFLFAVQIVLYVGQEPLRMAAELVGPRLSFGYDLTDIRDIDGEALLASDQVGDNVIAVLTRSHGTAVQEIVRKVAELEEDARNFYLGALLELAGLRGIEELVEGEARKMPILMNILDNKVLGREYKRGELAMLRRQIEARFGVTAEWLEERLRNRSAVEIEELGVRLLKAESLEELLK